VSNFNPTFSLKLVPLWRQFYLFTEFIAVKTHSFLPKAHEALFPSNFLISIELMKNEVQTFSTVNEQLRSMIENYLANHSSLTLNALAERSKVAATTLRRLVQGEQGGQLAPHSVLALVSYLLKEKRISSLLNIVDGPVAEILRRSFDQFIFSEESKHEMSQDLNTLFQDRQLYLIYKLAANQCGTSASEIVEQFGSVGLQKLQYLIEQDVIISGAQNRLHAKQKNFSVDLTLAHNLTHSLLDFYKPLDVEKGLNLFYSLSEGMNEAGIQKIKEIEKEAVKKIFEIMNQKQNQGMIPYFSVVISDVLGSTPKPSEGVLQ
jgi:AraC-like DNA-binding protein